MRHGMPTNGEEDEPEVAFANQAKYHSLYVMKKHVLDPHRSELPGLHVGKRCIRYARPDQIHDWILVERLPQDTREFRPSLLTFGEGHTSPERTISTPDRCPTRSGDQVCDRCTTSGAGPRACPGRRTRSLHRY
jgi:hypothetical protein